MTIEGGEEGGGQTKADPVTIVHNHCHLMSHWRATGAPGA
jgi:hypothetical protein